VSGPSIPSLAHIGHGPLGDDDLCGTRHDVSNPAVGDLAHNNSAQVPLDPSGYSGVPGADVTTKAALNNPPHSYGVVERTYSEWLASDLDTLLVNDFATLPDDLRVSGGALEVTFSGPGRPVPMPTSRTAPPATTPARPATWRR
jgi:hypothetical protein